MLMRTMMYAFTLKQLTYVFLSFAAKQCDMKKVTLDECLFRWYLNEDKMATEKLTDGIRVFNADSRKLESVLLESLENKKVD